MDLTRRDFIIKGGRGGAYLCLAGMLGCKMGSVGSIGIADEKEFEIFQAKYIPNTIYFSGQTPLVSIVKINDKWSEEKGADYAIAKAIDLIGGLNNVAKGKERILLKPNLVTPMPSDATNPQVVGAIAKIMKNAGKDVFIGEASAASIQNMDMSIQGYVCRTKNHQALEAIQDSVFDELGYADLSKRLNIPLVNLHVGKMARMEIPDNFVFKKIYIHEEMYNADMVCSVPMMKTHTLATVTLAMKNVGVGGYPGLVYGTVRSLVHQKATELEPTGTSSIIIDMVKASKIGLNVIDASTAMQGQGPTASSGGELLKMNLIIASTHALAADMVAATIMGFDTSEIDTFAWAWKAGMKPSKIDDIEIVGEKLEDVKRPFKKPNVVPYTELYDWYGPPCRNT